MSACSQAVIAAETGHLDLAYDYLAETALMDIDDLEHNTRDGLHIAALAGSWIALVQGFGGMRYRPGQPACFAPRLPPALTRLTFTVMPARAPPARRGRAGQRHLPRRRRRAAVADLHHGTPVSVAPGQPETRDIPALPARPQPRPEPPSGPGARAPWASGSRELSAQPPQPPWNRPVPGT